jgi:glyoxylate reductase
MKVFVTRKIPELGLTMLREKGYEVVVSNLNRPLTREELILELKKGSYDAVLSLLTETIDAEVFDAASTVKIFANYAVGFNNINVTEAKRRKIFATNTPGNLIDSVAEHTFALLLSLMRRIVEADTFVREGNYVGWDPMIFIGPELKGSTMGIIGSGHIGARIAYLAKGFDMNVIYYDVVRNEKIEKEYSAVFCKTLEEVLVQADVVTLAVPLLDSTRHLINAERLSQMKPTAYLINTARGPIIDENALVVALKNSVIQGAGIDVFEFEPKLAEGLAALSNVVLTPHIASATEKARNEMARLAAENIIEALEGPTPKNVVPGSL